MAEPTEAPAPPAARTPARTARPTIGAAIAAAEEKARRSLLRNHGGGAAKVSELELFFDLVFVFAVTQLAHFLLGALTPLGTLQTAILFGAVWWAWMYTTWATNWVDPNRGENRLMLGAVMLASLVMSAAIPYAYGKGALVFAAAYVAIQLGRSMYVCWAMEREERGTGRNLLRISLWFAMTAPLWIGGGLVDDTWHRIALWSAALAIDYVGPAVMFRFPGLGRSTPEEWVISGHHMAERCGLFIIIALGEGLLITGKTYSESAAAPGLNAALVNAFLGSFAMWWLYFDIGAERAAHHVSNHRLPGLVARQAFTYWHIPIVAGIVLLAVADEKVLAHPLDPAHLDFTAVVIGGGFLFIGGLAGFKRISSGNPWYPASHRFGLFALVPLAAWGILGHPPSLYVFGALTALFVTIAVWEWVSFHGGWLPRMEKRNMWLGRVLRRRVEKARVRRENTEAGSREESACS